jgi:5-methylcytosine-specific restriction endonuclease McrA
VIDTSAFAIPKPGHSSGRLILSGKKYSANKERQWKRQGRRCARCPLIISDPKEAHFHHKHGRGMGGGKRDDRRGEVLCVDCHEVAKIERREVWA